ncbi:type I polyketide synthase [Streptomyces aidingensis]|uniref:Phenolphthiocerol/phthiocerol polyketide synthase subunit E n=1 Tax=Streptomyces aidingensis TaxID=910347 RepID=A0A1I1MXH7_9ACTN|nr:type I polyketide synthase [Streptomyces aidingensis]SFC87958.1 Acyl transferase domain-containing protein [Streptomyces aidingensis]
MTDLTEHSPTDIALVGMAGRFPGAGDVGALWRTVRAGRTGITTFTDEELRAAGVPEERLADPTYVKAGAVLDGIELFDAEFFGMNPREAQILDPQHRLFLEHCWHALEDAACDPARLDGSVGVFAGCAWSSYLTSNLTPAGVPLDMGVVLGNEKDTLATRAAHLLGLTGPALAVQTACSTSLVAVCLAANSLAGFQCDVALAGGVSLSVPHRVGYQYQPGGIASPDGRCRAFDAAGQGAPLGSGVGVVALRRLEDALADGDRVYAVLRGWAVNNDGDRKAGFTAPGVDGQAAVIEEALGAAGLDPGDVDYLEAHGTGTALGDAAEITALQRVFHGRSLSIGSVKTNVGHLDRAAGVTGLIKAALALHHEEIPATLHLERPNPQLTDGGAELTVVTERQPWPRRGGERPRRAGVSAFGIGGTNAHVVLEEAPPQAAAPGPAGPAEPSSEPRPAVRAEPLVWSARTAEAADRAAEALAGHLETTGDRLTDIAHTLATGRRVFAHRRMLVAGSAADAAGALRRGEGVLAAENGATGRPVRLLLDGTVPAHRPGMAQELRAADPEFRAVYDSCREQAGERAADTPLGGAFVLALALGRLVRSWGVEPAPVAGRGPAGHAAAACLAGVMSPADALALAGRIERTGRSADAGGAGRAELTRWVAGTLTLRPPALPAACPRTGRPLTAAQATDPAHWAGLPADGAEGTGGAGAWPVPPDDDSVLLHLGPETENVAGDRPLPVVAALPGAGDARPAAAVLAEAAGRLWLAGAALDWSAYRAGRTPRRVGLPGYPFQRKRYWIDPVPRPEPATAPEPERQREPGQERVRLLVPEWHPAPDTGTCAAASPGGGRYRIVPDRGGVAGELARLLRRSGAENVRTGPAGDTAGDTADTVVDLSGLDRAEDEAVPAVRSVAAVLASGAGRVLVATRGGQAAGDSGSGSPVSATQAALGVLPVVAGQEHPGLDSRCVDLDPAYGPAEAARALAAELARPAEGVVVAHRAGRRLLPGHAPAPEASPEVTGEVTGPAAPGIRPGGTYLITGGLGVVGRTLAGHLIRRGAGRVVLTSRSGPGSGTGRLRALHALRDLGAEIVTPRADVTDPAAMRELFLDGERIDGVIHAAADADQDGLRPLADLDEATVARHFGAKVRGARVLAEVLDALPAERRPDWCMLFSSTSAVLGGLTLGAYAAANAALAAHARGRGGDGTGGGTRWISAAWDTWPGTLERVDGRLAESMAAHAMTEREALAAFDRVLELARPAVVAAAGGLDGRLPTAGPSPSAAAGTTAATAPRFPRPDLPQPYVAPRTATERRLAELWSSVLGVEPVGVRDNFFDLSGNSLLALRMLGLVKDEFGVAVPTVTLFDKPTVRDLATVVGAGAPAAEPPAPPREGPGTAGPDDRDAQDVAAVAASVTASGPAGVPADAVPAAVPAQRDTRPDPDPDADRHIAIVGMAGRFPGAGDVGAFWRNLCDGVESISFFTPEEMIAAGVAPEVARDPAYVAARPVLDDITGFDAGFFGLSPRMAALTDPQQRLFLEVCWEALEQSGYCRPEHRGRVGVFGGCNLSTYLLGIAGRFTSDEDASIYELVMGNDKDALTTTVSYLFDLRGPSVAVQSFCSTSLVAVHTAVRALRAGECEMAMAGGVSVRVPDRVGHLHSPGGQESPDGHVRAFDAQARGSMFGDGAAVVVLKKLGDALRDGDHIWAVIRGSALNNDGALKAGYTAPSVTGQAAVIADAMADAGVTAEDVGYVEAHGTGTVLGDPIEVAALTRAFGPTGRTQYCALGSVKPNVGHLDRAAGTTGLIKTAMVVRDGLIPPTLHFTEPNPEIDFAAGPFRVAGELTPWQGGGDGTGRPRIAGLNSLGMGGTNVHVVVEQPPGRPAPPPADPATVRRHQVLPVSARTADAADASVRRLAGHLRGNPDLRLADVAFTLQVGRRTFEHRRVAVAGTLAGAVTALDEGPAGRIETADDRPVAFLFAGVGEQYPGLVGELYRREPVFRAALDDCLARLPRDCPAAGLGELLTGPRGAGPDLAALLGRGGSGGPGGGQDRRAAGLERTEVVQPLLFAVDYALARTLMEWGVRPSVMLGYSLGEYVAACLSGVLSLDDALALVAHRAALIARHAEPGAMAAVPLPEEELRRRFPLARLGVDVAALNGPELTVVAGPADALDRLAEELRAADTVCRPLRTTHAFHSRMLAPVAERLTAWIREHITLNAPAIPYLSNVTGGEADAALVTDPAYWARHMCEPVRFHRAAGALLADEELAVVEIGPGQSLGALLRSGGCPPARWPMITSTLPAANDRRPDDQVFADCLARLWLLGADIDWAAHHRDAGTGRIPLPTYPFQRQRYWIDPAPAGSAPGGSAASAATTAAPAAATGPGMPELPEGTSDPLTEFDRIPLLPEERWLHVPVWRQSPAGSAPALATARSWLVFTREGAAERIAGELARAASVTGARLTLVRPGDAYRAPATAADPDPGAGDGPAVAAVRPGNVADALALLRDLKAAGALPDRVVHLWNLAPDGDPLALGLHTLVALARGAGDIGLENWALDIVASGTQRVLDDAELRPDAATLTGPALVIPMEYPTVSTRLIDTVPDPDPAAVAAELHRPAPGRTVALRGRRRWLPAYQALPPADPDATAREVLREGGVYLITGGLGGIGLAMAEQLARACRARLVLFGRRGLPPRERWRSIADGTAEASEQIRARVRRVLDVLEQGGEVEIVEGDVAEPADVLRAVELARERFGALHGVLHTAGVPGTGLMQFKQPGDAEQVLAPKLAGSRALDAALERAGVALDFLVLFSSITSVTGGGPGQVDYCAANAFLDAWAPGRRDRHRTTVSVAWGEWTWNAWDEGLSGYEENIQTYFREHRARFGIAFDQGWRTLLRALAAGEPHVVVSTQDLPAVADVAARFSVASLTEGPSAPDTGERHPRPDLVTPYREPQGPAEEAVARAWSDALRLERVGVLDNFFELGGTSLLGITLLSTLRKSFPDAELPPHVIHEAPTVSALARLVEGTPAPAAAAPGRDGAEQARLRRSGVRAAAARRRRP